MDLKEFLQTNPKTNFMQSPEWAKVKTEWKNEFIIVKDKKMDDVVAEFMKYNVPVSKLQLPLEALNSKHFNERDMVIEIDDANIGKYRAFGLPVKFSKTPGSVRKTSPLLGEDTKAILESIGYSDSEINEFIKEEIVTVPENN